MFKLIILIVGVVVGFGGGIYWSVQHPTQASSVAAEEERRMVELQIKMNETFKQKLDAIAAKQKAQAQPGFVGSGFLGKSAGTAGPNPDIISLSNEQDQQIQQLQQRLSQLKK